MSTSDELSQALSIGDSASHSIERGPASLVEPLRPRGKFHIQHFDRHGNLLGTYDLNNGITDLGLNALLDVKFHSGTQVTTWYIGLIDNASYSALSNSDTLASHTGWVESSAYTNSTRPQWTVGAASSRSSTNSSTVDFTMNATTTVKGIFIASDNTKGGTTGELWSTAAFGSNVVLNSGDTLKTTYTVSG